MSSSDDLETAVDALRGRLAGCDRVDLGDAMDMRGTVASVGDGIARVVGLGTVGSEELVVFDSGARGMAYDIEAESTGVVLLSGVELVRVGQGARATGALPGTVAGPSVLGRALDPFGDPLDDLPAPRGELRPALRDAPMLIERASVTRSLHTGVMAVDAAIPIGRGQRQLILGDRNTGKTALALDIVHAQRNTDVVCVYVVIGQPLSRALAIRDALHKAGAMDHTVVIAAESADPPAMQYLAPYAGTSIAEWFREQGRDAVVVYDDLTKHADAYRELALLLGRPPGREAFPGDIFYIHGELLERASAFSESAGGGSVTAFPIVETTDGDISAYIPTNLISITDGQIYLETGRFERNQRPAIDIGRSVSRIGGAAQTDALRKAAKNLRIEMARFEGLESLTRVGLDVDPKTQQALARGRTMRELLKQPRMSPRPLSDQVLTLTIVAGGCVQGLAPVPAVAVIRDAIRRVHAERPAIAKKLDAGTPLEDDERDAVLEIATAERARRETDDEAGA